MLQFITHRTERYDEVSGTEAVLEGGCRWVQLRMKDATTQEIIRTGREIGRLCRAFGATFIVDDRVDLVEELRADGVHLGRNDMPVADARRLLGRGRIIGATANTFDDAARAAAEGADYLGIGPFRFTSTKRNLSPILGVEGCRRIAERCRQAGIVLPTGAIGGIGHDDIAAVMATGITGIALSGALLRAEETQAETRRIIDTIKLNRR
ncbi:MAG: thiamine phosphate synthase [Alistipes sp.]|nr:thiamine phosphate synthase [Alistipes sp.]